MVGTPLLSVTTTVTISHCWIYRSVGIELDAQVANFGVDIDVALVQFFEVIAEHNEAELAFVGEEAVFDEDISAIDDDGFVAGPFCSGLELEMEIAFAVEDTIFCFVLEEKITTVVATRR